MTGRVGILGLMGLVGCATEAAPSAIPEWRLVGLYDSAALLALEHEGAKPPAMSAWRPHAGMSRACGPVKHPDGLGMFEAEAVAAGHSPALVVLLEATTPSARALTSDTLRVSLRINDDENDDSESWGLHPMVDPRRLALSLSWEGLDAEAGTPPEVRLVETQLRVESCMEHKTGRAWIGGDRGAVRQAYLLDPPRANKDDPNALILGGDRRYYVGQPTPVPAMLGPSETCVRARGGKDTTEPLRDASAGDTSQSKGEGSLDLIPTDVWGAEVPVCEKGNRAVGVGHWLPWRLERSGGAPPVVKPTPQSELSVHLRRVGEGPVQVTLTMDKEELLSEQPLFSAPEQAGEEQPLVDLLAHVPLRYPRLSHPTETSRVYTALIIPAWQLNEALDATTVATGANEGDVLDGVGWALRHPDRLSVLVHKGGGETDEADSKDWASLTSGAVGERVAPRSWGYIVGHLDSRAPLLAVGSQEPSWTSALIARRADAQAVFLLSCATLLLIVSAGLWRVRDLWSAVPEEPVTWWPTPPDAAGKAAPPPPQDEA